MNNLDNLNETLNSVLERYSDLVPNYDFIDDYFRTLCPFKLFSNVDVNSDLNDDEVIYLFEDMSKEDYNKLSKLVMKYYIWK